jgi:hypothetical protein
MANHPLQSKGVPISLNDISKEFNRTSGTTASLNSAKSGTYGSLSSVTPNPTTGTNTVTGAARNGLHLSDWYGCYYNPTPQTPGSVNAFDATYNAVFGTSAVDYATAHSTPVTSSPGNQGNPAFGSGKSTINNNFICMRAFIGYDTTAIVNATAATITYTASFNSLPKNPTRFVLVQTNPQRAYNYQWNHLNFNDANGQTICSNIFSVTAGQTGVVVTITLNAAGLALLNGPTSATFAVIEYDNDYLNTATGLGSVAGSPWTVADASFKLNYS